MLTRKCEYITALVFRAADALYSMLWDNNRELEKKGIYLRHEVKYTFNKMISSLKDSEKRFLAFTKVTDKLSPECQDTFLEDSQNIEQFLYLYMEKILGQPDNREKLEEFMKNLPTHPDLIDEFK